jgi:hypothetical protein
VHRVVCRTLSSVGRLKHFSSKWKLFSKLSPS